METVLLAVALAALVLAALAWARPGGREAGSEADALREELRLLAERIENGSTTLGRRLEGIDDRMLESQSANTQLARDIFQTLGDVRTATSAVADQAKQFSSLQDLLKAPAAWGALGEAMLEELLRQVLPPSSYSMQHRFRSGTVVDAVVKVGGKLICIDSKFPLANYRGMCNASDPTERRRAERAFAGDVERHIKDIASRYLVPDEGTLDFAVMYVPAEGVYAEVLRLSCADRPLFDTAIGARVIPMSPLTTYGYLQTILFGLKCLSIEKNAETVVSLCSRLQQDISLFASDYETLGRHLTNARGKFEEGGRRLDRVKDKLDHVVDLSESGDNRPSLEAVPD
jgi:DNA recombination protein RmuC